MGYSNLLNQVRFSAVEAFPAADQVLKHCHLGGEGCKHGSIIKVVPERGFVTDKMNASTELTTLPEGLTLIEI